MIDSFYGLRLGMTKTQVVSKLESQNIHFERKSGSGGEYLHLSNVRLGDCVFQELNLSFKNGKLVSGAFISEDGAGGFPESPAFSRVERNANNFKSMFNTMYANLSSKYGNPQIADGEQYIWIRGNKLTLDYIYTDDNNGPYMRQARTMVRVLYKLNDSSSSNY